MDAFALTPPPEASTIMSLRAYAVRRGVSPMAVTFAIRSGRLSRSVTHTALGFPKIADPDLADREWDANTDHAKAATHFSAPGRSSTDETGGEHVLSFAEAAAREKLARAKLAELEYQERIKSLVDAKEVEARFVDAITRCRAKVLGIPSKLKSLRPNMTREDLRALDRLIRETLEDLAAGDSRETTDEA